METLPNITLHEIVHELMPTLPFEDAWRLILQVYIEQKLVEWQNKEQFFVDMAGMDYETYEREQFTEWDSENLEKIQWFNQWTNAYSQVLKYQELKQKCEIPL